MGDAGVSPPGREQRRLTPSPLEIPTRHGPARIYLDGPARPLALVVLGHGAGGDSNAVALLAVRDALVSLGCRVARVDAPYRVAGRRAPDPAPRLDASFADVVSTLRALPRLGRTPLVTGGKSSGARVACRTAATVGAQGVVALGFPLHPPGRPDRSRAEELLTVTCPVLVCQGARDSFGTPSDVAGAAPRVTVVAIEGGDHSFVPRKADGRTRADCLADVTAAVTSWLRGLQLAAT